MPERPPINHKERPDSPEKIDKDLEELAEATAEEQRILDEMRSVLETTPDRREAEKIIMERLAPKMDEVLARSRLIIKRMGQD